ncbi:DUF1223 domain-containing protein [Tabrizicola sp. DMG-N-6]|uniref:DUF1223 domain-containing protein n=2 Tax=Szabonella alba TaxID=2804194 RepID=A0A8K0VE72_9RHOB|nr:DUF1223 domain-containing protein [Szabonella alba]MBL4917682.1 DUF1223 domain-containing protein [Szabonella alba]
MAGRFVAAVAGMMALAGTAIAQQGTTQQEGVTAPAAQPVMPAPVVIELYTSQGCSSCPPADEFMARLAEDPRVIALALHVDYWDYLGWKDRFADAQFTARQKSYAKAIRDRMVYTPQMIVQGQERVVGSRVEEVEAAILRHIDRPGTVHLVVERETGGTGRIIIRAEADPPPKSALRVQLVRYRPSEEVEIGRGENSGRSMIYHNIVTSWQVLGEWNGQSPLVMEAEAAGSEPAVVILQSEGPSEIVAAQRLP